MNLKAYTLPGTTSLRESIRQSGRGIGGEPNSSIIDGWSRQLVCLDAEGTRGRGSFARNDALDDHQRSPTPLKLRQLEVIECASVLSCPLLLLRNPDNELPGPPEKTGDLNFEEFPQETKVRSGMRKPERTSRLSNRWSDLACQPQATLARGNITFTQRHLAIASRVRSPAVAARSSFKIQSRGRRNGSCA